MSRNVPFKVGALLRRPAVDQPPLPVLRARIYPPLAGRTPVRSYTSTSRVLSYQWTTSLSSQRCGQLGPTSALFSPPRISRTHRNHTSVTTAAGAAWRTCAHKSSSSRDGRLVNKNRRNKSSVPRNNGSKNKQTPAPQANLSPQPKPRPEPTKPADPPKPESELPPSSSKHHLLDRLPQHLPHLYRPTKAELLEAASGFWSRIKIHFKWLTIRSSRPFNADEIYAMVSWILAAHILWIVIGTTTFFSLAIFLINTVFAQETLAQWIGNYLTQSSGIKVVFESAVVPKWKDGVISFSKVFVSRRPGQGRAKVSKGSQLSAAAAAAEAVQKEKEIAESVDEEEDTNYTQFDISIDTVNVTLSFSKWFNGKGLLKDVEIRGIRGVVDRTFVYAPEEYIDPRTYKHEHNPGDFELDSFKMEDLLLTVYQTDNFRPYSVSIYSCDLPQLRKQWLFYDFLSANMMSGSFDNSLFTIHPRQTHNYTGAQLLEGSDAADGTTWKKQTRIRIDGLNIDHLNRGYEGPFSWIHEGNVDIVADIMIPDANDDSIAKVMSDMYDRVEATVSNTHKHFSDQANGHDFNEIKEEHHDEGVQEDDAEDKRFLIMDVRVNLNDVRAAVPIFTNDISYINNALVRPIVAYINSKKTFIPVNCRVVKRVGEFDGSWTVYDSGLMDDLSREMYDAFARDVLDDATSRKRRIKKVGIWTLQLAAQALFLGLAGNIA
ncbi:hypothetical protein P154DRAFT_520000 [Amniculicola lignicola CBS 123094]|uniref:Mitochondrial distribution and morphology protein family 31/32 n=1 Tax=Amniculicola lignicola CBS 123094 TaxID=1392246 RepID=A0A6A5WNF0_9PLEO|nr:hypothetical protein P154DRAFT_520000 [Amniculicola lignicola CBS 123094]